MPELSYDSVRVHNGMAVELWVCMFPGDFVSVATAEMVLLPPGGHVDRAVRAQSVRLAVRRGNEARMFVVRGGSYLHLERADQPRPGTSTTLGTAEGAGEAWHARIQDIECSVRTVSNERTLGSSWDVLPGPLFWRLPRNDRDVAFEEGAVLHAHHGHITFKVVRDLGADWRGQPTARVRVVQGGWHEGRLLHRGSMHVAKLLSTERAVVETVAAHKQLGGMLGPPAQVARLEYQLQLDFGPWLLLFEDFGWRMPEYLEEKGALSAEDVDRCAVDLLAALSAMHRHKLHHLALSPASILLRRDAFGRLRLKLADLGVVERPSETFPPGHHTRALAMSYVAPELEEPDRLAAAARLAVEAMAAPARKEAKVLQCLERSSGAADGGDEALESREPDGPAAVVARAVGEAQEAARSLVELNPAAELASDALLLSARAAESFADQWERLQNMATNRYGQFVGQFLGDLYGGLFAKDILWMFRAPSRTPRYPVLLVRDAEDGNLLARWRIAASIAFESELCERSAPLVVPSIRPAFTAGFQIGAAIGRNRAMNFKLLWIDAFLGSFFRQISAQVRIWLQRVKVTSVRWDKLGEGLREAVARGRSARVAILLRYGRLPTSYDQNAPRVLQLLPSTWVPDVGLPLADGIGRGFFRSFWSGWRAGRRKRYVRPRFEAWDLDDTPAALRDFARQQGAEQASLVASSVGDTLARDAGWHIGTVVGVTSGLLMVLCRRKVEVEDRIAVAGGRLQTDEDMAMEKYI